MKQQQMWIPSTEYVYDVLVELLLCTVVRTDSIIQKTLRDRFGEYTVLTIAHRLNTIMDSDRILVSLIELHCCILLYIIYTGDAQWSS